MGRAGVAGPPRTVGILPCDGAGEDVGGVRSGDAVAGTLITASSGLCEARPRWGEGPGRPGSLDTAVAEGRSRACPNAVHGRARMVKRVSPTAVVKITPT